MAVALSRMSKDFDALPGFGYVESSRAYATAHKWMNRADGTVLIGFDFLHRILARPVHPDAALMAVTAHEFGHIVRFKRGIPQRLGGDTTKVELHADFLSGWYAGRRRLNNDNYPAVVFAQLAAESGGGTHGTGEQRAAAVQHGLLASARDKLSLDQAIEVGIAHVQGGFKAGPVVPFTSYR